MANEQTVITAVKSRWNFAQSGGLEHYALACASCSEGPRSRLYTNFWAPDWVLRGPMSKLASRAAARSHDHILRSCVVQTSRLAFLSSRFGANVLGRSAYNQFLAGGVSFGRWLREWITHEYAASADAYFLLNISAPEALQWLRERGQFTVLGQIEPACIEHELVSQEHDDWPDWAHPPLQVPDGYWDRLAAEWGVREAPSNVEFRGAMPRSAVAGVYAEADVFVSPTLSDGFALTQLEAMAHDLPVIAALACGEVVEPGVSGFRTPSRDVPAVVAALKECEQDRLRLAAMFAAARLRAAQFSLVQPLHQLDAAWAHYCHGHGKQV